MGDERKLNLTDGMGQSVLIAPCGRVVTPSSLQNPPVEPGNPVTPVFEHAPPFNRRHPQRLKQTDKYHKINACKRGKQNDKDRYELTVL